MVRWGFIRTKIPKRQDNLQGCNSQQDTFLDPEQEPGEKENVECSLNNHSG